MIDYDKEGKRRPWGKGLEEIGIKIWSTEEKRNKRKDNNIGGNVKTKRDEVKKKKRQNNFSSVIYSIKWSGKRSRNQKQF